MGFEEKYIYFLIFAICRNCNPQTCTETIAIRLINIRTPLSGDAGKGVFLWASLLRGYMTGC